MLKRCMPAQPRHGLVLVAPITYMSGHYQSTGYHCIRPQFFPAGELLCRQNDHADCMWAVRSGRWVKEGRAQRQVG